VVWVQLEGDEDPTLVVDKTEHLCAKDMHTHCTCITLMHNAQTQTHAYANSRC